MEIKNGPTKARPAEPIVPLMDHISISYTDLIRVYSGMLWVGVGVRGGSGKEGRGECIQPQSSLICQLGF